MASLADGGIVSSISDLARWDAALYRDEPVKQSILKQMWTPFMLLIFLNLASGLNLYYVVSNIATIPQQMWITNQRKKLRAQVPAKA